MRTLEDLQLAHAMLSDPTHWIHEAAAENAKHRRLADARTVQYRGARAALLDVVGYLQQNDGQISDDPTQHIPQCLAVLDQWIAETQSRSDAPDVLIRCACGKTYGIEDLVAAPWDQTRLMVPPCWLIDGHARKAEDYVRSGSLDGLRDQAMAGGRLQKWCEEQGIAIPDPTMLVFQRPDSVH